MTTYKTKEELLQDFDDANLDIIENKDMTADTNRVLLEVLIDIRNLLDKDNVFNRTEI
jgi:hypothetical protein